MSHDSHPYALLDVYCTRYLAITVVCLMLNNFLLSMAMKMSL